MSKIAIFASGAGTNTERLIHYFQQFKANNSIEIGLVVSNKTNAKVLDIASKNEIPTKVFSNSQFEDGMDVFNSLKSNSIDWIVLAGFLRKIPLKLIENFPNRIFNIHPSLLPKYGGKGMYGANVHRTVLENKEVETGITIHLIDEEFDRGEVLFQASCKIASNETLESLTQKIHALEYEYYPKVIFEYIQKTGDLG
tara:strand:- start:5161 stop:5751 length:591 start_codon:yes stop_codon:yes gene_type:complete